MVYTNFGKMKKINIYLRHTSFSPNTKIENRVRPKWFDKRKIWENFLKTVDNENCDFKVVYDTHFGDNSLDFFPEETKIIKINCGNEASSFLETLKIIESDNLPDDAIVYILEDDYLHRENWCEVLVQGLEISDYVTLYDHLDKYLHYDNLLSKILITNSCHWRTTPSTCNTYACKMSTLKSDIDIHRYHSIHCHNNVSDDNGKFINLRNRGRSLISPIPGFSTHCDAYQSPLIDWESYIL